MATKAKSKKKKLSEEEEAYKNAPVAEIIIGTALKLGEERNLTLGELIGHVEVAKIEIYGRVTAQARQAAEQAAAEQAEGDDTEKPVAFDPDAGEDKA